MNYEVIAEQLGEDVILKLIDVDTKATKQIIRITPSDALILSTKLRLHGNAIIEEIRRKGFCEGTI